MTHTASANCRILLVGLPGSGKTTFLAALWYSLTNSQPQHSGLKVRDLGTDRTYLNQISEQWMKCEQVERTLRSNRPHSVQLRLSDADERRFDLLVPDVSGELFRSLWEDRSWPADLVNLLEQCQGILLFVHPDQRLEAPLLEDVERQALAAAAGAQADAEENKQVDSVSPREFAVAGVNETVQIVDVLQCLFWLRGEAPQLPVAVVISAWDRVPSALSPTPAGFLRLAAPLLYQFLASESDLRPIQYWGVSAQGGHYPDDAEKLSEIDAPVDRVRVVTSDPDRCTHDLSAPLVWLLQKIAEE